MRLWRSAGRYDPERSSVRTFVYTLARRAAVDLWRRSARAPVPTAVAPETADEIGGAAFDDVVLRLAVGEALESLTPAHREVLDLQYNGDLTQSAGRTAARHPARHRQDAHAPRAADALAGAEGARSR